MEEKNKEIIINKGLPQKRSEFGLFKIFLIVGVVLFLLILIFQSAIEQATIDLYASGNGMLWTSAIGGLIVSTLVSIVQAWIFRENIHGGNQYYYILAGAVGGLFGGFIAGALSEAEIVTEIFFVGGVIGLLAGGSSSLGQLLLITTSDLKKDWFIYSFLSWGIIFSIGWKISWSIPTTLGTAIGAGIVVIASGFSLWLFFRNSKIEF